MTVHLTFMFDTHIMSPTATNERRPSVHERHATSPFGAQGVPASAMVMEAVTDEPEIGQLFSLKDTSVVVTGGARGLGVTIAAACVESGADVLCCDILAEPSQPEWCALESQAKRHGVQIRYVRLDICDSEKVEDCFQDYKREARFPLKGIVHCAGVIDEQEAIEYDMQVFNRIMRINVDGTMIVAKAAARVMREAQTGGSIVLIASISGSIANRGLKATAYNSSKSAVLQMCRSLAVEWGQYNIRVNTLSPGYIR